jgi:hypothetical protein
MKLSKNLSFFNIFILFLEKEAGAELSCSARPDKSPV